VKTHFKLRRSGYERCGFNCGELNGIIAFYNDEKSFIPGPEFEKEECYWEYISCLPNIREDVHSF